jgi:beta-glucosidase
LQVGYRGFAARGLKPLFAFGHGLSYTSFAYAGMTAPKSVRGQAPVKVQVTLRNSGARAGREVVQLYVAREVPLSGEADKALRSFAKVAVPAGATRKVTLTLDPRAFSYYDTAGAGWRVRPGKYRLMVGGGSDDIRIEREIVVAP